MVGLRYGVPHRHISNSNREHPQLCSALIIFQISSTWIGTRAIFSNNRDVTNQGTSFEYARGDGNMSPGLRKCQMNPPTDFQPNPQQHLVQRSVATKIEHSSRPSLEMGIFRGELEDKIVGRLTSSILASGPVSCGTGSFQRIQLLLAGDRTILSIRLWYALRKASAAHSLPWAVPDPGR